MPPVLASWVVFGHNGHALHLILCQNKMELSGEFVLELTQAQPRLFGFLFKRLANREQAKEVLQQTNLVLCRKADDFELGTNFNAWAMTVAHYQALSYRKTQARDRLVFTDEVASLMGEEEGDQSFLTERLVHLRHCYQSLSEDNRNLLSRRYDQSESIQHIATELSRTVGAVKVKLHRLRRKLMHCIENRLQKEKA